MKRDCFRLAVVSCALTLCACGGIHVCEKSPMLNQAASEFGIAHIFPEPTGHYIILSASTEKGLRTTLSLILMHDYLDGLDETDRRSVLTKLTKQKRFMDRLMERLVAEDYERYLDSLPEEASAMNERTVLVRYARILLTNTVCKSPGRYMGIEHAPRDYFQCTASDLWRGLTVAHPELNCVKRAF